jgi:hypothetical protein
MAGAAHIERASDTHRRRKRLFLRVVAALALLIVLLVIVYGVLLWRMYNAEPNISTNYLDALVADVREIPEEDRGWPLYLEVFLALEEVPVRLGDRHPRPGEPGWQEVESYLERNGEALALVRQAAAMPAMGHVPGRAFTPKERRLWPEEIGEAYDPEHSMLIDLPMKYLGESRNAVRALNLDAYRAAAHGAGDVATVNIDAVLSMADHLREIPFLLNDLCAIANWDSAAHSAVEILATWPDALEDEDLQSLSQSFAEVTEAQIRVQLDGERLIFLDFLQRAYTDDGSGRGSMILDLRGKPWPMALRAPIASWGRAGRKEMLAKYDELVTMAQAWKAQPLWQRGPNPVDAEMDRWMQRPWLLTRYEPIQALTASFKNDMLLVDFAVQRCDAARTAIALELYHRRHGDWPDSLAALVPDFLPEVPRDRYDGGPIKYRLVDEQPVLYSVGADRDDDRGVRPLDSDGNPDPYSAMHWVPPGQTAGDLGPVPDADWVLYPPYAEPLESTDPGG